MALYLVVGLVLHFSLRTNAYDLSLFDYALWNSLRGRLGWVPFIGHSIFSEHFMPILFVLTPVYALWQSPVALIVIQLLAVLTAALLLIALMRSERLDTFATCVIVLVFLISRPSFLAVNSFFYPESLQPALVFASLLAWRAGRFRTYWVCLILLLMTKEDASLFVGSFAIIQWFLEPTRRLKSAITFVIAVAWFTAAIAIAIPYSRAIDGLPSMNHFINARYGTADGSIVASGLVSRVLSVQSATTLLNVLLPFGLLSLGGPELLAVIGPALIVNLAANQDTLQAAVSGHYLWPMLPWIAAGAVRGYRRLKDMVPRFAIVWCAMIGIATIVSSPIVRNSRRFIVDPAARVTLDQLPATAGLTLASQPNLVPHLTHDNRVMAVGHDVASLHDYDVVLLTTVGDTWPFSTEEILGLVEKCSRDPAFDKVVSGPLFVFRRSPTTKRLPAIPTSATQ